MRAPFVRRIPKTLNDETRDDTFLKRLAVITFVVATKMTRKMQSEECLGEGAVFFPKVNTHTLHASRTRTYA